MFADASTVAGDGERIVYLTDGNIENSSTLEACFRLIHYGNWIKDATRVNGVNDEYEGSPFRARNVILFFAKYSCDNWIQLTLHVIHSQYHRMIVTFQTALVAACVGKDLEMVASLLDAPVRRWEHGTEVVHDWEINLTVDDLRGFGLAEWEAIPPRFTYAITRVMTTTELTTSRKSGRGQYFLDLMKGIMSAMGGALLYRRTPLIEADR